MTSAQPYANRYGVSDGDGEALLTRFLEQSGLPETTRRTVELMTSGHDQVTALTRLRETVASDEARELTLDQLRLALAGTTWERLTGRLAGGQLRSTDQPAARAPDDSIDGAG